jgi:predicted nucleotidyltransferase
MLKEEIVKNNELNSLLFNNDKLLPEVKEKLENITDNFIELLKENEIKVKLKDILVVGSNASYNYSKDSDIDLHIIVDGSMYEDKEKNELLDKIYNAYKTIWNSKYDVNINEIPVELYVELDNTGTKSNGIYSVKKDKWIKKPIQKDIPEIDYAKLNEEVKNWENKYKKVLVVIDFFNNKKEYQKSIDKIDEYINNIYDLRQLSMKTDGEYGLGNLIFKEIRNNNYLNILKKIKTNITNKKLSI